MSEKLNKVFEEMVSRRIYCPEAGCTYGEAIYHSISEYEAITGMPFKYTQEDYERNCS